MSRELLSVERGDSDASQTMHGSSLSGSVSVPIESDRDCRMTVTQTIGTPVIDQGHPLIGYDLHYE